MQDTHSISPPPLSAYGDVKGSCHRFWGGAYYVSCQKRLCKTKYGPKGLIFKCQSCPVLAKQPINV